MRNSSGKWLMLDKDEKVVEGEDNPKAVSVLVAPGGNVPQDVVDKYDLGKKLEGEDEAAVDAAGVPVVQVNGIAISANALPEGHPDRPKGEPAKVADKDEPAKPSSKPHDAPRDGAGLANAPASGKAATGHTDAHKKG